MFFKLKVIFFCAKRREIHLWFVKNWNSFHGYFFVCYFLWSKKTHKTEFILLKKEQEQILYVTKKSCWVFFEVLRRCCQSSFVTLPNWTFFQRVHSAPRGALIGLSKIPEMFLACIILYMINQKKSFSTWNLREVRGPWWVQASALMTWSLSERPEVSWIHTRFGHSSGRTVGRVLN